MLVIAEVCHFVEARLGPAVEIGFLADIADGSFDVVPLEQLDWLEVLRLVATTDASVIVTAQRLGDMEVATLDRRHFDVLAGEIAFDIVPLR